MEKIAFKSLSMVMCSSPFHIANSSLYPLAHNFRLFGVTQQLLLNFETACNILVKHLQTGIKRGASETIMTFVAGQNTSISSSQAKFLITTCSSTSPWMGHSFIGTRSLMHGSAYRASSISHLKPDTREKQFFHCLLSAVPIHPKIMTPSFIQLSLISPHARGRVWHGFGKTRGFDLGVVPGMGKGQLLQTLIKPLPVRRVPGSERSNVRLCEIIYFGPWCSLVT